MKKYTPYIVIAVLLVSLFVSLTNRKEVVIEKIISDTVFVTKIDTVKIEKPIFITETIVDTFLVKDTLNNEYLLPKTQRYYSEPNKYDAWVSGYKPNLDSIHVYNKTEFVTITNNITKEIYPKTTDFYFNMGVSCVSNQFIPNLGLTVKFKKGFTLGGEVGLYNKQVFYGAKLGLKLNRR